MIKDQSEDKEKVLSMPKKFKYYNDDGSLTLTPKKLRILALLYPSPDGQGLNMPPFNTLNDEESLRLWTEDIESQFNELFELVDAFRKEQGLI